MVRTPPSRVMVPSPASGTAASAGAAARSNRRGAAFEMAKGIGGKIPVKGREIDFHGARTRDGLLFRADHREAGADRGGLALPSDDPWAYAGDPLDLAPGQARL